jgi:hypothetical protein
VVVTLTESATESEVKTLETAENTAAALAGLLSLLPPPAQVAFPVIAAYLAADSGVLTLVDQGNGVYLTLPWPAIWYSYYWLIVPTPVPVTSSVDPTKTIMVRLSTGNDFGPGPQANQDWSHGLCYGSRGTFFADVDGDGRAECILVNDDSIWVRRSTGSDFGPGPQASQDWSQGPCYGSRGTFFADVDGDGKADCILVNDQGIWVRLSTGSTFRPNVDWSQGPCYGSRGTFFADVNGDGKADCILVNNNTITVRPSTGSGFGPNQDWSHGPCYGNKATFFANVAGGSKAAIVIVNG